MNRMTFLFPLVFLFLGCATTHPGTVGQSDQNEIVVSVANDYRLSDDYYLFLEFTIENKTGEWKQVKFGDVKFDRIKTEMLTGDRLSAWIEGAELKLRKAQYNTALILGSVAAVGSAAALSSNNQEVQAAGATLAAGSLVGAAAVSAGQSQQKANSGNKGLNNTVFVPKTHILAPFSVAPESYVRRWVVLSRPKAKDAWGSFHEFSLTSPMVARTDGLAGKKIEVKSKITVRY